MFARCALFANVLLWALVPAPAAASDAAPPVPDRYVTDTAGVLSASTAQQLDSELKAYETSTGHQVIVWIGQSTGGVPLEDWTAQTAHEWRIGRKKLDDGAVLFLFMRDRKVRIEVGYGLESHLTDAGSKRIIDRSIVPKLRSGDVNGAVSDGVHAMLTAIGSPAGGETPSNAGPGGFAIVAVILLMLIGYGIPFAIVVIAVIIIVRLVRKGGKTGSSEPGAATAGAVVAASAASTNAYISSSSNDDFSSSSSSSSDFSSGGGDFGGGGASGSW